MQLLLNAINDEAVTKIAAILHEANRHVCVQMEDFSQPPWDEAPHWQKKSAINGVRYAMSNGYPTPEGMHDNWMAEKEADGWKYGEEKDPEAKTHPCMVPYDELSEAQKFKDFMFRTTMLSVLSIWSGAPQMGPLIPTVRYEPPVVEAAEVEEDDEQETNDDPVVVLDDEDDEQPDGSEVTASEDGGEDEPATDEMPEEDLTPQQKAARTRAANKAKAEEEANG